MVSREGTKRKNVDPFSAQSFPTPMEEPKKVLRAQYLGSMQVSQATGMEVLNDAIDHIVANTPINQWRNVNVAVAPSMISILTPNVSRARGGDTFDQSVEESNGGSNEVGFRRRNSSPSVEYVICRSSVSVAT